MISSRDFVQLLVGDKSDDGSELELTKSIEHFGDYKSHDIPPLKGRIRGEVRFSSVVLRKAEDGGILVEYIINSDCRGYIMASIFQQALKSIVHNQITEWMKLCNQL